MCLICVVYAGKKDYTLSAVEQSRIARVLQAWNQPFARSSYRLIRFPLLELACLGKIPSECLFGLVLVMFLLIIVLTVHIYRGYTEEAAEEEDEPAR